MIRIYSFDTTQTELNPIDKNIHEARWIEPSNIRNTVMHKSDIEFFYKNFGE